MTESVSMISSRFRRQALIWLVMAGVMLLLYFLVSLINNDPKPTKEHKKEQVVTDELTLPTTIDNLNELSREVPPIDFETVVRDLRNYPAQFKGKKFFQDNEKKWTVQVMDVAHNDTIADYLKGRDDRDKFAYFRYHTANGEQRYILTYGVIDSRQEALSTIKMADFDLPKSVDFTAVELKTYLGIMDNYERAETVFDASETAPRKINLKETKQEIPAQAPKKETPKEQTNKPKTTEKEKEKVADLAVGADVPTTTKPQRQVPPPQDGSKPKMPPTAVPTEINDKPKDEGKKEPKPESKSEKPVSKNEPKPETKSEPKPVQGAKVADLEPAPPMNIPGDD